jgi:hypothetical protein
VLTINTRKNVHSQKQSSESDKNKGFGKLSERNLKANDAKNDASIAAKARLVKMRKRVSLRSESSTEVSNVEAIINTSGDLDREVVNQLNEDELFELIASQEEHSVSRESRAAGKHEIEVGSMRRSSQSSLTLSTSTRTIQSTLTHSLTSDSSLSSRSEVSSTVMNALRNTTLAVSDDAAYGGADPSGSKIERGTAPVKMPSGHHPRASTIEEGDETGVSPKQDNRFSQV